MTETQPAIPWLQLVVQCGALGLLTWIITRTLPEISRAAREERESKDRMYHDLIAALQTQFAARNQAITEGLDRQTRALTDRLDQQTAQLTRAIAQSARERRVPRRDEPGGGQGS